MAHNHTISAVCPICRTKRYFENTPEYALSFEELCCSPEHIRQHYQQIATLEMAAHKNRAFTICSTLSFAATQYLEENCGD